MGHDVVGAEYKESFTETGKRKKAIKFIIVECVSGSVPGCSWTEVRRREGGQGEVGLGFRSKGHKRTNL